MLSVKDTEGPQLVAALEEHVKTYDLDIMNLQRAQALHHQNGSGNGLMEIKLERFPDHSMCDVWLCG